MFFRSVIYTPLRHSTKVSSDKPKKCRNCRLLPTNSGPRVRANRLARCPLFFWIAVAQDPFGSLAFTRCSREFSQRLPPPRSSGWERGFVTREATPLQSVRPRPACRGGAKVCPANRPTPLDSDDRAATCSAVEFFPRIHPPREPLVHICQTPSGPASRACQRPGRRRRCRCGPARSSNAKNAMRSLAICLSLCQTTQSSARYTRFSVNP